MELFEFLFICSCPAPDLTRQRRVREHAAPDHYAGHFREPFFKPFAILTGENIAIITDRIAAGNESFCEYVLIRRVFIKILLKARMDNQFFHRILVINVQNPLKFPGIFHTDSRLHRYPDSGLRKYLFKESVQSVRICKKSGTSSLADHGL